MEWWTKPTIWTKAKTMSNEAVGVYRVKRMQYGISCGHWGYASFERLDEQQSGYSDPHVLELVGHDLGEGSVIEVTVRVVTEKPFPGVKRNPWHGPDQHAYGHYGTDGHGYKSGDKWGCQTCHEEAGCCE